MGALLFDMDGVLYNGATPIPGAAEALAWVREQNIPHLFVTNTSSRSREELVAKLAGFGIAAGIDQVMTPAFAAAEWLRLQEPGALALFVHRHATHADFAGLPLVSDNAESGARYVVVGDLGDKWNFRTLNRAFRLLHSDPNSQLIALGMTRYWQAEDGLRLDVAPFVAALEHATGRRALVFGKPDRLFFGAASERLNQKLPVALDQAGLDKIGLDKIGLDKIGLDKIGLDKIGLDKIGLDKMWMLGDDIDIDVHGAQLAGMKGVLVRTGKFRLRDLAGPVKPDALLSSIAELPEWWLSHD